MDEPEKTTPQYQVSNLSWSAPEYEHTEKHADWYWLLGVIAGLSIFLSILLKNFLLAIIILLGSFCVYALSKRPPKIIDVAIRDDGIRVEDSFYYYDHLKSFAIPKDGSRNRLVVETDRLILPHINIPLGNVDPEEIRDYLNDYIDEKPFEESLSEKIFEFFGF